eukprot:CAMPEP_0170536942 /NCGR_PEP_ID=MMETSP0209-20121228/102431_1 /TAXON_ID=665100 ORGANISM="Litonotus pictus, Strain P1" /NCGR_SAMPLE_ID=MMETSP0209 /ASSEMBLY_ACC=CAM_ASM_000301 /LENGTH=310 /DNA_ID=CAMNT_0010838369 /DNA_START=266 /DNA_END=1198 /DNA_ORIENTATION=-
MMTVYSLIILLDQIFYTHEENRRNIQVGMNNSFSGFITSDSRMLEAIMKFERNMKRNPKIIEELKAKNPSNTKAIDLISNKGEDEALPLGNQMEEEEDNDEELQNSKNLENISEEEEKEYDDSSNNSLKKGKANDGKAILDYERAFSLYNSAPNRICNFNELHLKEHQNQRFKEDTSQSNQDKPNKKLYEEGHLEEFIVSKPWYNHKFEQSSQLCLSTGFAGNNLLKEVLLIDDDRLALINEELSYIDIYNFRKSHIITTLKNSYEKSTSKYNKVLVTNNKKTLVSTTNNYVYFWDLEEYKLISSAYNKQ